MKIKINFDKVNEFLFFLMGLLTTMSALQFKIGINLALYNYIAILIVVINLIHRKSIRFETNAIIVLNIIYIVSYIVNLGYLPETWLNEPLKFIFKNILMILLIMVIQNDKKDDYYKLFFKGLYISTIAQMIWEFLELFYWYGMSRSLNQLVFGQILGIEVSNNWIAYEGMFRPMGISWEPANLSMSLIFGFILSNNSILKLMFFVSVFLTGSKSGIVGMVVTALFYICLKLRNRKTHIKVNTIKTIRYTLIVIIAILLIIIINNRTGAIHSIFNYFGANTLNRFRRALFESDASTGRHIGYYKKISEVFSKYPAYHFVFGFGTVCSGLPYSQLFGWYSNIGPWCVESDFVTYIIGNGILGILIYYYFLISTLIRSKSDKIKQIIVSVGVCGLMYVYLRTWIALVLYIISSISKNEMTEKNF